jgi:hypothetical protein
MNTNNSIMNSSRDHIMANTWRLIFERKSRPSTLSLISPSIPDFSVLEQLLPEYRLIGLCLADNNKNRRLQ